jgi:hypothetical protein
MLGSLQDHLEHSWWAPGKVILNHDSEIYQNLHAGTKSD